MTCNPNRVLYSSIFYLSSHWFPEPSLRKGEESCRGYDALSKQVRHFFSKSFIFKLLLGACGLGFPNCLLWTSPCKFPKEFGRLIAVVSKLMSCAYTWVGMVAATPLHSWSFSLQNQLQCCQHECLYTIPLLEWLALSFLLSNLFFFLRANSILPHPCWQWQ